MAQVDGWLTVKQAADELKMSPESVYYLVRERHLGDWKIGDIRVIARADLDAYATRTADKRRPGPRPAPPPDQGE